MYSGYMLMANCARTCVKPLPQSSENASNTKSVKPIPILVQFEPTDGNLAQKQGQDREEEGRNASSRSKMGRIRSSMRVGSTGGLKG
jgi:hypothetical protein